MDGTTMTRLRSLLRLVVLVPTIVVIGCTAQPGAALVRPSAVSAEMKLPDSGITISPPGLAKPAVSSDAAFKLCTSGVADCEPGDPSSIQLAVATDTGSGVADSTGKLKPLMDNTLVWAISWLGIPCPESGGAVTDMSPAAEIQPSATSQLCDKVAFVNARSGAFIFTYTYPHP